MDRGQSGIEYYRYLTRNERLISLTFTKIRISFAQLIYISTIRLRDDERSAESKNITFFEIKVIDTYLRMLRDVDSVV